MKACEWCGKLTSKLVNCNGDSVCGVCAKKYNHNECIKCGTVSPLKNTEFGLYRGLCVACRQLEEINRAKKRQEAIQGIGTDEFSAEMTFTEADFEKWMVYDTDKKGYTPKDFKDSFILKKIWIMTKLNAAGITDEKIINENLPDILDLIDTTFDKLINNKCRLTIVQEEDAANIQRENVIGRKNKVVILSRK